MRRSLLLLSLAAAAAAAVAVSVRLGAVALPAEAIWRGVLGRGDPTAVAIVGSLRLPRAVQAALVGGSLGLSGAAFQALLRNPLAEPYILGVSGGAAVGAVTAIAVGAAATSPWAIPTAAFAGALGAIALVLRLAHGVGRGLDVRVLLLAGVVAGAFFNACILLLLSFQEAEAFRAAVYWMMGSLAGSSWATVALLAGALLPAAAVLAALARPFDLLAVGEEPAAFLGVPVQRVRILAYLAASLLAAATVVVAGGIGFVGLFVPHTVRLLWGGDHRLLLPASFLLGATFLPLADTAARLVAAPAELPLGVVTAFVGVPFFLLILRRQAGAERL